MTQRAETVIRPSTGWRALDLAELLEYRDLYLFLVWRSIKTRYAQSVLGVGWAIIQPAFQAVVFTIVFGRMARVPSDGAPYALFSYAAILPWTYFAASLTDSTDSLVTHANMISKVYFPRLILPLAAVTAKLVDLAIASVLLGGLLVWYRVAPAQSVVALPWLVLLMMTTSAGCGIWLTALAIQYRDVRHAMTFVVQLLMFVVPVVYPLSLVPRGFLPLYALNPMVGVIEGFRAALLRTTAMPWRMLFAETIVAIALLVSGSLYFRRKERIFADVA